MNDLDLSTIRLSVIKLSLPVSCITSWSTMDPIQAQRPLILIVYKLLTSLKSLKHPKLAAAHLNHASSPFLWFMGAFALFRQPIGPQRIPSHHSQCQRVVLPFLRLFQAGMLRFMRLSIMAIVLLGCLDHSESPNCPTEAFALVLSHPTAQLSHIGLTSHIGLSLPSP